MVRIEYKKLNLWERIGELNKTFKNEMSLVIFYSSVKKYSKIKLSLKNILFIKKWHCFVSKYERHLAFGDANWSFLLLNERLSWWSIRNVYLVWSTDICLYWCHFSIKTIWISLYLNKELNNFLNKQWEL